MNKFLEKTEVIFALALIVSFFLPWVSLGGLVSFSGFSIPDALKGLMSIGSSLSGNKTGIPWKVYLVYLLYLIPLCSAAVIILGLRERNTKIISIATAILPFAALACAVVKFGNVFAAASIGVYLTLASAFCLLLAALGIIRFRRAETAS